MYPEDRVLVGVINRKRDFDHVQHEHWYRIPQGRAPHSIDAKYVAFYFSRAFKAQNGGIYYFAERTGYELVRRRDLLPEEPQRADDLYYKLELGSLREKIPPILNPTARAISFIYTTWDRFSTAATIAELYSKADWFVVRVTQVLKDLGITPELVWQEDDTERISQLRIACQNGIVLATTGEAAAGILAMSPDQNDSDEAVNAAVQSIREAVALLGGPTFVNVAPEG
jgi:hypothetical protein